ncbi:MAG: aromatic amino acid lyase, partial [Bacteroidota bacterium]
MKTFPLDGNSLTVQAVHELAYRDHRVLLTPAARKRVQAARALIESWVEGKETVYGVTTGFGEFSNIRISRENIGLLQENLIMSHAAGAGEFLPPEIVRAMMVLRINALAKGFSGVRLETLQLLVEMVNKRILPAIPSQGSVGASGDLVQLAHMVLSMMGRGRVLQETKGGV